MAMTSRTMSDYQLLLNESGQVVMGFGSRPSTVPGDIADGALFWDTDDETLYHYTGSAWSNDLGSGTLTLASGENLTITSGTFTITSGSAVLTSGNLTLTSGNLTMNNGDIRIPGKFWSSDGKGIKSVTGADADRSVATRVVNILGSLAVLGAAAAETVRARYMQVYNTLTARTLTVSGNATVAGTLGVTGTSTLTGATDVVGALTAGTVAADTTVAATTTVTAGTGITATTGNITATAGNLVLTAGNVTGTVYGVDPDQLGGVRAGDGRSTVGGHTATKYTMSKAQRILNVFGSLAVLGSAAAETIRCRAIQLVGDLTVGRGGSITHTNYNLKGNKALTGGAATTFATIGCPSNGSCGGQVKYTIIADDGTDYQSRTGIACWVAVNKAGTVTAEINDNLIGANESTQEGGITCTFTATEDAANVLYLKANAASDLTETTLTIYYEIEMQYPNTITAG